MIFELLLTENCNINCRYCFEGVKKNRSFYVKDVSELINFFHTYVSQSFVLNKEITVNFNGGEALLEFPLMKELVSYFEKDGINNFSLSTNLILANDEILDFLNTKKFSVQISIDGKKESHDMNRVDFMNEGTFDAVMEKINLIHNKYPLIKTSYSMLITPSTVAALYENVFFLVNNGCKRLVACYCADYEWDENSILFFKNELDKIKQLYIQKYIENDMFVFSLFSDCIESFFKGFGKYNCGGITDQIGIKTNGDILFCGTFFKCKNESNYLIGNIHTGIDSHKIKELLFLIDKENEDCSQCSLNFRCHHNCYAINNRVTNDLISPPVITCEMQKTIIGISDQIIEFLLKENNETFLKQFGTYIKK
jgi:uncharacterized protein